MTPENKRESDEITYFNDTKIEHWRLNDSCPSLKHKKNKNQNTQYWERKMPKSIWVSPIEAKEGWCCQYTGIQAAVEMVITTYMHIESG